MANFKPAEESRIGAIDELRGLAFLAVLASHFGLAYGLDSSFAYSLALPAFGVGVDLFFVISGYVVAQSYQRLTIAAHGDVKRAASAFWLRRGIRIALPAWTTIIIIAIVRHLSGPVRTDGDLTSASIFVANFYWAACSRNVVPCPDQLVAGHFWSLALEMQFYLAAPLLLAAPRRLAWPVSLVIVIFGVIAPRPVGGWLWSLRPEGFLLGLLLRQKPPALPPMSLALALYWLAVAAIFERIAQRGPSGFGLTIVALIFAFVLAGRLTASTSPHWGAALLRGIGRFSYAAYLVHLPALTAVRDLTLSRIGPGFSMLAAAIAILVLSVVADLLIVRPAARLSRRVSNGFIITNCVFLEVA